MASPSSRQLRRSFSAAIVAALTLASSMLVAGVSAPSVLAASKGDTVGPVEVSGAVYSDVSAPIRDLTGVAPAPSTDKGKKDKEKGQKQQATKDKQDEKKKLDMQPKRHT